MRNGRILKECVIIIDALTKNELFVLMAESVDGSSTMKLCDLSGGETTLDSFFFIGLS